MEQVLDFDLIIKEIQAEAEGVTDLAISSSFETTFLTAEEYAIDAFKVTGRTVMVSHTGDAPVDPVRFRDPKRNLDIIAHTATNAEIDELLKIPEFRKRYQILEGVPYTDIIIGDEVETPETLALRKKRKENLNTALHVAAVTAEGMGMFAWMMIKVAALATFYVACFVLGAAFAVFCGKDPIVWARLPGGEWLEICRFYQ